MTKFRLPGVGMALWSVPLLAVLAYAAWGQQPAPAPAPVAANAAQGQQSPYYAPPVGYTGNFAPAPAGTVGQWTAKEVQLERQSQELARQIARTDGREAKEKLTAQLADVLTQQFEEQQKR